MIFLNSQYTQANADPAITEYLDYIRTNDDSRNYTTELLHKTVEKVQEVRSDEKMEVSYMMWELKYQDAKAEGRAEDITERAISDLKNLMETLGLSLEQARSALEVSEAEQQTCIELLKQ